jgi:hypothetical protein
MNLDGLYWKIIEYVDKNKNNIYKQIGNATSDESGGGSNNGEIDVALLFWTKLNNYITTFSTAYHSPTYGSIVVIQ